MVNSGTRAIHQLNQQHDHAHHMNNVLIGLLFGVSVGGFVDVCDGCYCVCVCCVCWLLLVGLLACVGEFVGVCVCICVLVVISVSVVVSIVMGTSIACL